MDTLEKPGTCGDSRAFPETLSISSVAAMAASFRIQRVEMRSRSTGSAIIFLTASDDWRVMAAWQDDLSECSLEDVLRRQAENRAWGKELLRKTNALVNNRLAKNISLDDYVADRKIAHEDAAEYRRRADILYTHMSQRAAHPLHRES
jgi:hypothetical protein